MKNLVLFLKNNLFIILIIGIFLSFFAINYNVVYFGDDYYFLSFKDYNVQEYIKNMINFYCIDNGRLLIHILVTCLLKMPMIVWQILNSIMLSGICVLIALLSTLKDKTNRNIILVSSFFLLSSIEIMVARQSIYWLTGSLNYVYPCFILLIFAFLISKLDNIKHFGIVIFFAFIASASMEQSAMMAFGLTILLFLSKFKNFKDLKNIKTIIKNNQRLLILILVTLIGACTVLLAPAQFNRIKISTDNKPFVQSFTDNLLVIISFCTTSNTAFAFSLLFIFYCAIFIFQNETNKKIKISMIISLILGITILILNYFVKDFNKDNPFLFYVHFIIFLIQLFYLSKKIYNRLISPITIALILLIGSQAMMLVSPFIGYRNFIFGLISYIFIVALTASKSKINNLSNVICIISLIIFAIILNIKTASGYYQNKVFNEKNVQIITNNEDIISDKNAILGLYMFSDENYSWSAPYVSDFHLSYFKKFYNIKCTLDWRK